MTEERRKIVGVIGGMGPQAGLDLTEKIIAETRAASDQEHVPVALLSFPDRLGDRAAFLAGETTANPAHAIAEIARELERLGAGVAGIASSAAHIPRIFDVVLEDLRASGSRIRLLHMAEETVRHIREEESGLRRIGVLSTLSVYRYRLFASRLEAAGLQAILPDDNVQESIVNRTIFDPGYGLKANPVSQIARQSLINAIDHLRSKGAEGVILGSTELPLAIREHEMATTVMFDASRILARALIRETYPERLK